MFGIKVIVSREQDSEFRSYDDIEENIPADERRTVGQLRRKYADRLNLAGDMICLINGSPVSDETVVKDDDTLFYKEATKARGA